MNGIIIDIDPVIFHAGGFAVRWYGLTFAAGILLAIWLTVREARRQGLDPDGVSSVAFWGVVGGLAGARLFHVVDRLGYYLANPMQILAISQGGLAIWGGLLVGGLAAVAAARRAHLPVLRLADATVPGLILGQMLGRLGCIVNGDAYGGATGLPWGFVYVNPGSMVPNALRGIPTHPYPIYEILWDTALLGALLVLRARRRLPHGALFAMYAVGYAVGRFTLTFVRQEAEILWGLQQAQVVALVVFLLAASGLAVLLRNGVVPPRAARRRAAQRAG